MNSPRNCRSHRIPALQAIAHAAVVALLAATSLAAQAAPSAHYTVHATGAGATEGTIPLAVTLRLEAPPREFTVFEVPVWTPGSYRLRDFPERITMLGAKTRTATGEQSATVEQVSRTAWLVRHGKVDEVEIDYRVALRPDDRFMDPAETRRCLTYEGPAVYLRARDTDTAPCHVRFDLPPDWTVASGLAPRADGMHFATNYDVLADCPVKLGVVQRFAFQSHGVPIEVVLDAGSELEFDCGPWLRGLQGIVDEGGAIFGGLPFERYVFLYTASRQGAGGGLEHLNSTAIGLGRAAFRNDPASSFDVSAHEFFHCWNVKRLRPIELGPFTYDRQNRTTGLWLAEGVTSYYGPVLQTRAGLLPVKSFWREMEGAIRGWENTAGRGYTSPEQASWRVWDQQPPDRVVDYYGAGQVLGLLLDLQIRAASNNQRGLDDAMRTMWTQCEQQHRGLTSEQIEAACSAAAGTDLGAFFAAHVRGTRIPDYTRCFEPAGITASLQNSATLSLRGLDLSRPKQPMFTDWPALEAGGGGNPVALCGKVRQLDEQPVTDAESAKALVAVAVTAGKTTMRVDFETATGAVRTVHAALEPKNRVKFSLQLQEQPTEAQRRIRDSITAARHPKPAEAR